MTYCQGYCDQFLWKWSQEPWLSKGTYAALKF